MVVCRYWQQGQCRFGSNCKFEHTTGGFSGNWAFGGQQQQQQQQRSVGGQDLTNTLVQTVKVDVDQWEKGKQWNFSCYSPAKELACFPGIDDISPEELRLEAYTAKANNTIENYKQRIQDLLAQYETKRKILVNPTEQIKDVLRKLYNKESVQNVGNVFESAAASNPFASGGSIFSGGGNAMSAPSQNVFNKSSSSIFGTSSQGQSTFGGSASSGSIFGASQTPQSQQSTNIFGGSTSSNTSTIFGQPKAGSNVFGQSGSSTLFGSSSNQGQTQTSSIFGSNQQTAANTSSSGIFANSPSNSAFGGSSSFGNVQASNPFSSANTSVVKPAATGGIFGQSSSPFGQSIQQNQPQTTAPATLFGTQNSAQISGFAQTTPALTQPSGNTTQTASPFSTPSTNNAFGVAASSSPFSAPSSSGNSNPFAQPKETISPFGGTVTSSGDGTKVGLFGKVIKEIVDNSVYSLIDDLSEEEKQEFLAENFTLGKIPENPPTREMCV